MARGVIYCMGGLCDGKSYVIWRKVLCSTGYGETLVGNDSRRLAVSELAQIGRYFRTQFIATSRKQDASLPRIGDNSGKSATWANRYQSLLLWRLVS